MLYAFIFLSLLVGVVAGVGIGYETRDLRGQPTGLRPWLWFVLSASVIGTCAWLIGEINEVTRISGPVKTLSLIAGALAFAVALYLARRPR